MKNSHPLIVIVGETASGKSGLALELAGLFDGEIVNADAWNVYTEMNIGTAKPSDVERSTIKHHIIDIKNPNDDYTVAEFKTDALESIKDISSRGKLPIMVGGNGLYVDSVLFDYSFLPPGEPGERERLNKMSIEELLQIIELKKYSLVGIDIRNKRRLVRLIENKGKLPEKKDMRKDTLVIGLRISRTKLRNNIENRVEEMFRRGLRKEVDALVAKYGWEPEAMKGIGYYEFKQYYQGEQSMTKTKQRIVSSTLKLAKRQRTWFKKNQNIEWIEHKEQAFEKVRSFLNTH
ncbi:TPA: tRNA (adenosine(37)-N6)-dimethylallyltransferase MiaA [Candidatus Saccharibacteria bacterium]|nr:tRNA (adenosine(37)-N6)-dimethylallyltransferase MiaA [Candidatus Saccharibacteria bacterium]HIO87693.1 tRNA (adenosine(37)-N6)-dimethylallyltransferase MiaA [Candidatus Saccharibacteria bacterium]